jgi:hypothetical protein
LDSSWPSRLVCERCYSAVLETVTGPDLGCAYCGRPAGADRAEISYKAPDKVGMHFWMCHPCMNADFPGGLPERAGSASPVEPGASPARLWMTGEKVAGLLQASDIPADARVLLFLPVLWISQRRSLPANQCVQSCLTLRHAYGQLGIRTELRAVELVARKPSGRQVRLSCPDPSWQGGHFAGHCVLWLPDSGRFIDPAVQQFTQVALLREGPPVMGRLGLTGGLPAGRRVPVLRDDLILLYTVLAAEHTAMIVNSPDRGSQRGDPPGGNQPCRARTDCAANA